MPLNAPPAQGYPDGQRLQNYDTPTIYTVNPSVVAPPIQSPILYVGRFAYLGGFINESFNHSQHTFAWYTDSTGSVQLAQRHFQLSAAIGVGAQIRIPNLGPFFQHTITRPEGGNVEDAVLLFLTNRSYPLEFVPIDPVLVDVETQNVGAGATVFDYPTTYYGGPVQMVTQCSQNSQVVLSYQTGTGTWDEFWVSNVINNGVWTNTTVIVPTSAWRFALENTSGVLGTYDVTIIPSTTGAS